MATLTTAVIIWTSVKDRNKGAMGVAAPLASGIIAYAAVFCFSLLFYLQIQILDVFVEELIKCLLAWTVIRHSKPLATVAVFAFIELSFGKVFIMYLSAPNVSREIFHSHSIFVALAIISAYLMHISTGVLYNIVGFKRGILVAISVHFTFNWLASRVENVASPQAGSMLLAFSFGLVGLSIVLSKLYVQKKLR